jgi:uncharacterized protein
MSNEVVNTWPDDAITHKKENKQFFASLKQARRDDVFEAVKTIHNEVIAKTDCLACANCCRTTPALVTKADVSRISKSLMMSTKEFSKSYLIEDINGDMMFKSVPCVFLSEDNSCRIYDVRPEACRRYPHTDEREYAIRTDLNVANTIVCPAAFQVMEKLKSRFGELS